MREEIKIVKSKKKGKKWWKILLGIVAGLLAVVIIYVGYVVISYNRIEDKQPVTVEGRAKTAAIM